MSEKNEADNTSKITKGGLMGLAAGLGLAVIFPPLGAALVIAGAMGGAAIGYRMAEEENEESPLPEEPVGPAARLLDEFERWDRRLTDGDAAGVETSPAAESRPSTAPPYRAGPRGAPRPNLGSLYEQVASAEALLQEGRFLEAIDRFRGLKASILEATSGAGASDRQRVVDGLRLALHRLAGVLIENDSPAEAEELLKEALDLSPGNRETLMYLARLELTLNQGEAAEGYLKQAIQSQPGDPEPYRVLGDLYVETGRIDEARALFREAQHNAEDAALAVEMLERISGLDPDDPGPLIELGRAQAQEGNWEEAARAFRQALSRSDEEPYPRRRLGAALLRLGRPAEALPLLVGADGMEDDLDALTELSHHYAVEENDAMALPLLRRLRELDSSLSRLDPVERRRFLRQHGMEGDQVDSLYAPLRVRALLDHAAVEARSGAADDAAAAAREAITYGGSSLDSRAVQVATLLAAEFGRQGRASEAQFWQSETTRLGGSLEKVRQEKDTYEDFLRRFKYQQQDLIAEGGMARVYRGVDTRTGRTAAIKRMHDRFCTDPQAVAYFYREVRALEELSRPFPHPNVVEFIASGITESRFIFAMEFVDGPSLRQLLDRGELQSLEQICALVEGICAGLDRAHNSVRHIIHRDLKPENVLLDASGTPKLTDFGIARVSSLFSASRRYYGSTQSFVGTSLYSAPEQYPDPYSGQVEPVDPRADIYSVGCILYEILTTQPPFLAEDPGAIGLMHQRRPLPGQKEPQQLLPPSERNPLALARFPEAQRERLDAIVMRCLEAKPSRRYRTARDLAAELQRLRLGAEDSK